MASDVFVVILCDCNESGPLESIEDGIVIGNHLPVIKDEAVVVGIVMGHVDYLCPAELVLQLIHELDLDGEGGTCLLRLWHSRKSCW